MGRVLSFLYGIICYVIFLVSFLYAIAFVSDVLVPKTINSGTEGDFTTSILINLGLLGLFAIQHTIMARPGFKKAWAKVLPIQVERSTFVLLASLILVLLYWQWRPMTDVLWVVNDPVWVNVIYAIAGIGWLTVLLSTFMIDHFDLFGLRQVWFHLMKREYTYPRFQTAGLYTYVRHPIMVGFIIAFWATPYMTVGHLVFAFMSTAYIAVGVIIEEKDLVDMLGVDYEDYRRHVPKFIPFTKKHTTTTAES